MAVLPTLCAVLGLWPESDHLDGARREDMLPVAKAASQAAREAGTEVTGARAPWALLKHRRRRRLPASTEPHPHPHPHRHRHPRQGGHGEQGEHREQGGSTRVERRPGTDTGTPTAD